MLANVQPNPDAKQTDVLKQLGLPAYAGRAYVALLRLGTTEARHISEVANVPPAKVYRTLEKLQERGLVTVVPGKPRKYSPVAMGDFLDREIGAQRERLESLETRKDDVAAMFPILGTMEVEDRATITSLRGRRNISEHFRDDARRARQEILLLLPARATAKLPGLAQLLRDARARGVETRILSAATGDPQDAALGARPALLDLGREVAIAIFDGRAALLAHFLPGQGSRRQTRDVAILTDDRAIVQALAELMRAQWRIAIPEARTGGVTSIPVGVSPDA